VGGDDHAVAGQHPAGGLDLHRAALADAHRPGVLEDAAAVAVDGDGEPGHVLDRVELDLVAQPDRPRHRVRQVHR
jgi:hypothetical protein